MTRHLLPLTLMPLALAAALAFPAMAGATDSQPPPRIIVSGEGQATAAPDLALLTLSVMREAKTARAALDANNDAMAAVIAAMKSAGIKDRDLQTAGIQINPRYNYTNKPDGSQEAELVAYQVTNTLSVRIRDIDKTGDILDKAVSLGVNQGGGIAFSNEDPSAAVTEARKKAVANAMAKAKTLAEAAGVGIGRVLEITDQNIAPPPMPINAKAFDAAGAAVPVQAGENSYAVQVTVTFELK
ncbi:SIMPL domain-containing protein [Mesorhizobium waimense]|uniref:SIMPL domain-containing protein n=1 Tax=Mesorhizobium waimense TaxID=1300307 RepID=A0A3A5KX24_9HYPH|nr:SIMPL domain-containing protein [Mesorhizobium waimense]RJT39191.1 SIMPL domain-containing protein [Mesorhizobium waimense]